MIYRSLLFFILLSTCAGAADWDINQRPLMPQGPVGQCVTVDPADISVEENMLRRYTANTQVFNLLRRSALGGDNISMCILGLTYLEGLKTEQDVDLGLEWLNKSSDSGYPPASLHLYSIYRQGILTPADPERALAYLDKTLDMPRGEGVCRLAKEYTIDEIIERNLPIAKELYEKVSYDCDPEEVSFFRELTKDRAVISLIFRLILPTVLVVIFVLAVWIFFIKQTGKLRK
jgi:hypothetical protein